MRIPRTVVGCVAAATLTATTLTFAGPAQAQTTTVSDPRGDAWKAIDITRATFTNDGRFATARIKVADLRWVGDFTLALWTDDPEDGYLVVDLQPVAGHPAKLTCGVTSRGGDHRVSCAGVTAQYLAKKDIVLFQVRR